MLLIHGLGNDGSIWDGMRRYLEGASLRVKAPTLFPLLRLTENPPQRLNSLTFQDYLDEWAGFARRLSEEHGEKPIVIGHSAGGLIAQILATQELVDKAVFITPSPPLGCKRNHLSAYLTYGSLLFGRHRDAAVKMSRFGFTWGYLNCVPKSRHDEIFANARYDSINVFRAVSEGVAVDEGLVNVPTLTIGAGRDRAQSPKAVECVADKFARSPVPGKFLEYPEHGHWIIDEPGLDAVASDILDWFDEVDAAAAS